MDNNLINKLVKKINFDLTKQIDIQTTNKMSFVPINIQNDVLFVAVSSSSDKENIKQEINKILNNHVEFIYLTKDNFTALYNIFLEKYKEKFNDAQIDFDLANNSINNEEINDPYSENDEIDLEINDSDLDFKIDNSGDLEFNFSENITSQPEEAPKPESNAIDSILNQLNNTAREVTAQNKKKLRGDISKISSPQTKKLGEILIEEKLINDKQLEIALTESKAQNIPLGSALVKLNYVSIGDLKEALGAQIGIKFATNEQLNSISTAFNVLPEQFIKTNKVIPLSVDDKSLVVGMVNPNDRGVINEIIYQTGLKPSVVLITHIEFENFIARYYNTETTDAQELMKSIDLDEIQGNDAEFWNKAEEEIQESDGAVSQLANQIIAMAIEKRSSDIHIEPLHMGYRVRLRIDGSLHDVLKIPAKIDSALITRFKVLAKMNIAEHRRAQDGSFTLKYKNRAQDFRVNTLPVSGREKMVIRVLAPQMNAQQAKADKIEIVGAHEDDIKKLRYLVSSPNGIVLTSGPTGSGKTTTLYALIRYLNSDSVNITTIEDPVEIKLEGVNQSPVNIKAGITFANSLRAILRQDPDVILVGEIRDYETLEVAISASLTGHLVLSTIHTNSAAATVTRLIEMGAKDYLISSTISGIIAQRLVKKLCPHCKEAYYPTEEEARKILAVPAEIEQLTKTKIYRAVGCPACKDSGYLGRLAVLEILVIDNSIRKLIAQHAHDVEIEDFAIRQGMKTLKMSCLRHILEGNTTIDEQVRILGLASEG